MESNQTIRNSDYNSIQKGNTSARNRYPSRKTRKVRKPFYDKEVKNKPSSSLIKNTISKKEAKKRSVTPMCEGTELKKVRWNQQSEQASSHHKHDKHTDTNEFIQNYLTSSDIEDDAFELAQYVMESDESKVKNESQDINAINLPSTSIPQLEIVVRQLQDCFEQLLQPPMANEINLGNDDTCLSEIPLESSKNQVIVTNLNLTSNGNSDISDKNISTENCSHDFQNQVNQNCKSEESLHHIMSETTCISTGQNYNNNATESVLLNGLNNTSNNQKNETQLVTIGLQEKVIKEVGSKRDIPPAKAGSFSTPYISLTKNNALKKQITLIFNRTCYNYLNGRVCGTACKYNHKLPSAHAIFEKLIRYSNDTVMYMYSNFILKSNMSFVTYFPIICETFGNRQMEGSLLNAIRDCEQRNKIPFFKWIYHALVTTGLSKLDALNKIIGCCCNNRTSYNVFLEIIIETDPLYFLDMLQKYYPYGTITSHHMKKLFQQVVDTPVPSILKVFIDILDQYTMYDVCDFEMLKIVLLRTKSIVLGDVDLSQRLNAIELRIK